MITEKLVESQVLPPESVLIALGKRLFSFRTQKLSPVAAIILLRGKVARRRIIEQRVPIGLFFFVKILTEVHKTQA